MEWISQPWPWYVAGPMISFIMFFLIFFGRKLGMSSNLETMCAMAGGGKLTEYFNFDWKSQTWNLAVAAGTIIGGYIAYTYLTTDYTIDLAQGTIQNLESLGFKTPGSEYLPSEMFGSEALTSVKGILILLIGGLLIGFGTRYAGGCTSGHAISGLSNLQLPSLIAVIGFFIGGLTMVHVIFPFIF